MAALFRHILVPVDFTKKNQLAIAAAVQLAQENASAVTLLHVIERVDLPESGELTRFYDELQQRSDDQLQKLAEEVSAAAVRVSVETTVDRRAPGIVIYAHENEADLIVMSSHRVGPHSRGGVWGTISYQVAALCTCAILLLKQPDGTD